MNEVDLLTRIQELSTMVIDYVGETKELKNKLKEVTLESFKRQGIIVSLESEIEILNEKLKNK